MRKRVKESVVVIFFVFSARIFLLFYPSFVHSKANIYFAKITIYFLLGSGNRASAKTAL